MPKNSDPTISLLVMDDDVVSLDLITSALKQPGLEVLTAGNVVDAFRIVAAHNPQIVLTGLAEERLTSTSTLDQILEASPMAKVMVMRGACSPSFVVEAIKRGASDFLQKPIDVPALNERVGKLVNEIRQRQDVETLNGGALNELCFEGIIGQSVPMRAMFARIRRVAPHYRTLLITGETGTGKDLVAQTVHKLSPAAAGRYVVLNCSAVVETLFESELFGHVKGSFTGAAYDKPGLFEHADGGTLFLDEIGDMPLGTQAKLLRVLQNQEVQRVGSLHSRKVDVRVLAATNHDLRKLVAGKRFREDLYYRLAIIEIHAPPLADRKEDLPPLWHHFISRFAKQFGKQIRGLTPRAQVRLTRHSWPGNVRELENVIGHAAMMCDGERIDTADLPPYLHSAAEPTMKMTLFPSASAHSLEEQECVLLKRVLQEVDGNQSRAARRLRIGRDALRYKIKKHNLRIHELRSFASQRATAGVS